ncbi:MAG: hypothetical protein MUO23_00570 [Anaerolineales bacterium]|nr:hypothetical protein [Anaerolineales bacterium]
MPERDLPPIDLEGGFSLDPLLRKYGRRRARMEPMYAEMLLAAKALVRPVSLQRSFPAGDLPELSDPMRFAHRIVLGLCSLGGQLERRVSDMFPDEPARAVILDEIGNAWVAGLARRLHRQIRSTAAAEGLRAGPGYRPGIGQWPVELQPRIFHLLEADRYGLHLTGGLMMEPRKSVSMIIPVGRSLGRTGYAPAAPDQ